MYSDRYWEVFNEIDRDFDDVAVRTFKVGLPAEHDLRNSLTKKPVRSVCRLMDRINEYKRVEEDQQQRKGKAKVIPQDRRDFRSDRYNNNKSRRDLLGNLGLQLLKWLTQYSESQYIKSLRRSRMSHISNGQTRWEKAL